MTYQVPFFFKTILKKIACQEYVYLFLRLSTLFEYYNRFYDYRSELNSFIVQYVERNLELFFFFYNKFKKHNFITSFSISLQTEVNLILASFN